MKVYVVEFWDIHYSHIKKVFSTKEKADLYIMSEQCYEDSLDYMSVYILERDLES